MYGNRNGLSHLHSVLGASPEFISGGNSDLIGLLGLLCGDTDLAGTLSDIAGAEFVSGGADPVSALLGLSDIAGNGDVTGFGWGDVNPLNILNPRGNSILNPFHQTQMLMNAITGQKKQQQKQELVKAAINAKLQAHGSGVLDRRNQKSRRFPSPVTATDVAAGASATIKANPQTLFRPERFVVPASLAPSFVLTDLKVGNVSQFPNAGELPLEMFSQTGVDCFIELDTVNPALDLSVTVTNISGGTLRFRAGFIGTSVQ